MINSRNPQTGQEKIKLKLSFDKIENFHWLKVLQSQN